MPVTPSATFFLDGRINKTTYSRFDFLDFDGSDVNGGLEWKLGSNLNGDVTLGRTRNLRDFADFSGGVQRSIETATTGSAGASLAILSDYEINGRVGTSRIRNSLATSRDADLDEDSVTIGAAYKGRTGISLGVEAVFLSGESQRTSGNFLLASATERRLSWAGTGHDGARRRSSEHDALSGLQCGSLCRAQSVDRLRGPDLQSGFSGIR